MRQPKIQAVDEPAVRGDIGCQRGALDSLHCLAASSWSSGWKTSVKFVLCRTLQAPFLG